MDQSVPHSPAQPPSVTVGLVPPDLTFLAVRRLVGTNQPDPDAAATRLLDSARQGKIDLSLLFAAYCVHPHRSPDIRQTCLVAPSSGRTAAVFLAEPPALGDPGGPDTALTDRAACLAAAEAHVTRHLANRVVVLQSLPEPDELWAINALRLAGFIHVGELLYLRRPIGKQSSLFSRPPAAPTWPSGVEVKPLADLPGSVHDHAPVLRKVLEDTYVGTLDCPALCGVRDTADVLDSHLAVGHFDPKLWFLVFLQGSPVGCMLLSPTPELRAVELVYLGLAPAARGIGLGSKLMDLALRVMPRSGFDFLTCAVDRANTPAFTIYQRAGMRPFSERAALVKRITPNP